MQSSAPAEETELEYVERFFARALVVVGGAFWVAATFAGPAAFGNVGATAAIETAMWPLAATIVTLVIGWSHERLAAVLLFGASAAVPVWGILYAWEPGVWVLMAIVLIVPMSIAGVLFVLAARAETRRTFPAQPATARAKRAG